MTLTKEFKIGDLFEISTLGKQISSRDLDEGIGTYPYIMQKKENNGLEKLIKKQTNKDINLIEGGCLTIFTHLNKVYFQEKSFYTKQGSNVYTLRHKSLNKLSYLYLASKINKSIHYIGYGENTSGKFKELIINLPVKSLSDTEPDWDFMEKYIATEELKLRNKLEESLLTKLG